METITERIERAKTPRGGWNKASLAQLGVPWPPPRGWKKKLEAMQTPAQTQDALPIIFDPPASKTATGIEAAVCADIAARQAVGISKYGTTVADSPLPLRTWLQHAYEETLDKAVYLKRAIAELDAGTQPTNNLPPPW